MKHIVFFIFLQFFTSCKINSQIKGQSNCHTYDLRLDQYLSLADSLTAISRDLTESMFESSITFAQKHNIEEKNFTKSKLEKLGYVAGLTDSDELLFKNQIENVTGLNVLHYGITMPIFRTRNGVSIWAYNITQNYDIELSGKVHISFYEGDRRVLILEDKIEVDNQKVFKVVLMEEEQPGMKVTHYFYLMYDPCVLDWIERNKSRYIGTRG